MLYSKIIGTGGYLPEQRVSNEQLAQKLAALGIQTSDEWIVERTGIKYRHFAHAEQKTSDLAYEAAKQALANAGLTSSDIDVIIVATSTPDVIFPSTASILQYKLGSNTGAAFDVQAVCCGFIYALSVADAMIKSGAAKKALVVGAEIFSGILDFTDRSTCVLFGDGAGAVVLSADSQPGIVATKLHADGSYYEILKTAGSVVGGKVVGHPFLTMNGRAVFRLAVKVLEEVAQEVLLKADLPVAKLDWLVPHQANIRIMQSTAKKLGLSFDKVIVTVDEHGNTSAASVPLALHHGYSENLFRPGQYALLEGVGGGFTWGATLIKV